eukprot:3109997-Rhodomonas_salina.1
MLQEDTLLMIDLWVALRLIRRFDGGRLAFAVGKVFFFDEARLLKLACSSASRERHVLPAGSRGSACSFRAASDARWPGSAPESTPHGGQHFRVTLKSRCLDRVQRNAKLNPTGSGPLVLSDVGSSQPEAFAAMEKGITDSETLWLLVLNKVRVLQPPGRLLCSYQ